MSLITMTITPFVNKACVKIKKQNYKVLLIISQYSSHHIMSSDYRLQVHTGWAKKTGPV